MQKLIDDLISRFQRERRRRSIVRTARGRGRHAGELELDPKPYVEDIDDGKKVAPRVA